MSEPHPGTAGNRIELVINNVPNEEPPRGPPGGGGEGGADDGPRPIWCSEDALAAELVRDLGQDWKCTSSGEWLHWTGKVWEGDALRRVWNRARRICRKIANLVENAAALARKVSSAQTAAAAVKFAADDEQMKIHTDDIDRDIWLLNTQSGIVDLRTGQLQPHQRAKLMTKICSTAPIANSVKGGECPHWRQFLRDVTGGDQEFENYLQRVCGYLLTGSIEEHAIFFLYGPGGTGKSTFQNVVAGMLGEYSTTAAVDLFTVEPGTRHPTDLAALRGRRVVIGTEVDGAKRWNEALLKAISGGDRITAHFMHRDGFTFTPQFKLVLAGNDRPRLRTGGEAMRRRLHLMSFFHRPATVDKELDAKLRGEMPAILSWAIGGATRWRQAGGLNPPKVIAEATDEYFQTENTIGRWVDERCLVGKNEFALTRDLYRDFKSWAAGNGEYVLPERIFAQKLELLSGVEKARHPTTTLRGFRGLAPASHQEDMLERRSAVDDPMNDPAEDWPRE